ncbi:GNAT family N-acetyltransferase [Kineococcus sp. R8]|uniref:GNAT family N-acetyltransferase n=1 Tax=Kineococcus siccus TaxID=2696567 RepID=UPI001412C245|nr:GNAT family N-acetyltransferase [Kineococcus siccus]
MQTLESDRLRLRQWTADDAPFVLDMCSRWEVQRYIGATPRVLQDLDEASDTITRWHSRQDGLHRVWAVEHRDGYLLGTLLLVAILGSGTPPLQPTGETEIGWYFHPDAWGQGYAYEAATLVMDYAFAGGLTEVLAVTHPDNAPSQALCRRLGMDHLGRTQRYYNMTCELFSTSRPVAD